MVWLLEMVSCNSPRTFQFGTMFGIFALAFVATVDAALEQYEPDIEPEIQLHRGDFTVNATVVFSELTTRCTDKVYTGKLFLRNHDEPLQTVTTQTKSLEFINLDYFSTYVFRTTRHCAGELDTSHEEELVTGKGGIRPPEYMHAVAADGVIDLQIVTPPMNPSMAYIFRITYCPLGDSKNCKTVDIARTGIATSMQFEATAPAYGFEVRPLGIYQREELPGSSVLIDVDATQCGGRCFTNGTEHDLDIEFNLVDFTEYYVTLRVAFKELYCQRLKNFAVEYVSSEGVRGSISGHYQATVSRFVNVSRFPYFSDISIKGALVCGDKDASDPMKFAKRVSIGPRGAKLIHYIRETAPVFPTRAAADKKPTRQRRSEKTVNLWPGLDTVIVERVNDTRAKVYATMSGSPIYTDFRLTVCSSQPKIHEDACVIKDVPRALFTDVTTAEVDTFPGIEYSVDVQPITRAGSGGQSLSVRFDTKQCDAKCQSLF